MEAAVITEDGFPWTDRYLLGFSPMDARHREFVDTLNALTRARPGEALTLLDRFIAATEVHFREENDWMMQNAFPARACHMDEHQAVLSSLHAARGLVVTGRTACLPGLIRALREWFPGHADYLDSALAQWMSKKTFGGVPVVLKRNIHRADAD